MRASHLCRLGFGPLVLAAGLVGAAAPAHAASVTYVPSCSSGTNVETTVEMAVGDTLNLDLIPPSTCSQMTVARGGLGTSTLTWGATGTENTFVDGVGGTGTVTFTLNDRVIFTKGSTGTPYLNFWFGGVGSPNLARYIIELGSGGGGDSSSASASSAPPPVMQQFAKPASGTCDDAAPVSLNWAGVSSGGWGESWAQWVYGGAGGAVCTRTLTYSQSAGAWTVS